MDLFTSALICQVHSLLSGFCGILQCLINKERAGAGIFARGHYGAHEAAVVVQLVSLKVVDFVMIIDSGGVKIIGKSPVR